MGSRSPAPDWLLFLLPAVIWGTTWLVIKFQLGRVAPEVSVTWRFGLAGLLLLGVCAVRGVRLRHPLRDHLAFALLGLLQFGLNYVLVYSSEQRLTSGLVAVIFALSVLWNLLGARLLFAARDGAAVWAGAVLGMVGVALVFLPELGDLRVAPALVAGAGLAAAATVVVSAGALWSQRLYARGVEVLPSTAWGMLYAALAVGASCLARGIPFSFDPSPSYVASLAYLTLLGSIVAFLSYLTLLRRIGAGRAGYISAVIPVLAMVTSTLFEGYRWSAMALLGMALVVAGNVLVLRGKSATRPPPLRSPPAPR